MWMYYEMMMEHPSYKQLIEDQERVRRDRRVPRATITIFQYSSFKYLYFIGNDQALINATGHDQKSFDKLLDKFKLYYHFYTFDDNMGIIRKKKLQDNGRPFGRNQDMTACGYIGLILTWYHTRGSCSRALNMMFGQTSTPMYNG